METLSLPLPSGMCENTEHRKSFPPSGDLGQVPRPSWASTSSSADRSPGIQPPNMQTANSIPGSVPGSMPGLGHQDEKDSPVLTWISGS